MTSFVDFHCHLDLYPDFEHIVAQCEEAKLYTLAVTTTPRAWLRNKTVSEGTRYIRAALGLHPQLVASHGGEIALWERLLPQATYVGEVGLDGSAKHISSLKDQQRVFGRILRACTEANGKVLSIHAVNSTSVVLDMIEEYLDTDRNLPILHWFTGTSAEAKRAVELGCMFSINHRMIGTTKFKQFLNAVPRNKLITETDGPFTRTSNRPTKPLDVAICVEHLAEIFGLEKEQMGREIISNLTNGLHGIQKNSPST